MRGAARRYPGWRVDRCAAGSVQSARPGLGTDRLLATRSDRRRVCAVPRDAARGIAHSRRRAHRPCHGPDAPVADPGRRGSGGWRLPGLSAQPTCCVCWRWNRSGITRSWSARTSAPCRQGFRETLEPAGLHGMRVLWFERDGHGIQRAGGLGPLRGGDDVDARSADRRRLVAWHRHHHACRMRTLGRGRAGGGRDGGAHPRPCGSLWQAFVQAGPQMVDAPSPNDTHPVVDAAVAFVCRNAFAALSAADRGPARGRKNSQTCRARSTSIRTGGAG